MRVVNINSNALTAVLGLLTIVVYFSLMFLKKKLIGKTPTKAMSILNIIANIIILLTALLMIMFISGYEFSLSQFFNDIVFLLEKQTAALIASTVVIIISSTLYNIIKYIINYSNKRHSAFEKRRRTLGKVVLSFTRYLIYVVDIAILLSIWGIDVTPILAGLGIAGLVIGLGAQKLIVDFINGVFIIFERHFDVGDIIGVNDFKGEVIDIGLKTTKIRNWRGEVKIINNGGIESVINYSMFNSVAVVEFMIAHPSNVSDVIDIINREMLNRLSDVPFLLTAPKVIGVTDLKDNGIQLRVTASTVSEQHYGIERIIRKTIKEIVNDYQIRVPYALSQVEVKMGEKNAGN